MGRGSTGEEEGRGRGVADGEAEGVEGAQCTAGRASGAIAVLRSQTLPKDSR